MADFAWKKVTEKRKGRGWQKYLEKTFLLPTGKKKTYTVSAEPNVVTILALTRETYVILAKEFRPAQEKPLLELPGGYVDPFESPAAAAERELLEETGYRGKLQLVTTSYHSAYSTRVRYNFVATGCEQVAEQNPEDKVLIDVVLMPLEDFREHLRTGELTDVETGYLGLDYLDLL